MDDELLARLGETLVELAVADRDHRRFGAFRHRYIAMPPLDESVRASLEDRLGGELPADLGTYVTRLSAGGVGPYHGLFHVARAAEFVVDAPPRLSAWRRALPISHLGCSQLAVMPLDGPARGQIWIDARHLGVVTVIQPSFTAYLLDWVERLAHRTWPEGFVPVGQCPLQAVLSSYLHLCEQRLGLSEGQLAGDSLRSALGDLGPGAIAIAGEPPLFDDADHVDPCITCARVLESLREQGLAPDVVAAGVPPRPDRPAPGPEVTDVRPGV